MVASNSYFQYLQTCFFYKPDVLCKQSFEMQNKSNYSPYQKHSLEGVQIENTFRNNLSEKQPAALLVRFLCITRKRVHFNNVLQEVVLIETKFFLGNFPDIFKEANLQEHISGFTITTIHFNLFALSLFLLIVLHGV